MGNFAQITKKPSDRQNNLGRIRQSGAVPNPSSFQRSFATRVFWFFVAIFVFVATFYIAVNQTLGQHIDQAAMLHVQSGHAVPVAVLSLLGRAAIAATSVVAVWSVLLSLLQHSPRALVAAIMIAVGANATTQLLKHQILHRPDLGLGVHNSLPSGHTTLVASAAAVVLISAPKRWRPLLVAIAAWATAVTGLSTIISGWHRPADVVAALAITVVWTALATMIMGPIARRAGSMVVPAAVGVMAALVLLAMIGVGMPTVIGLAVLGTVSLATIVMIVVVGTMAPNQP